MSTTAERLAAYQDAELRILTGGQSVSAFGRQVGLADLAEIRKAIATLQAQLNRETAAVGQRRQSFGTSLSNFNTRDVQPDGRTDRDSRFENC